MERKLRSATAKLRNLKDLLSSTRNLNQAGQDASSASANAPFQPNNQNKRKSSKGSTGSGAPLSVSLFDLVEPCSRPGSFSPSSNVTFQQNPNTSVSMYGLSSAEALHYQHEDDGSSAVLVPSRTGRGHVIVPASKNPALRLFYTIRSKFRKHRDRGSKSIDSKSTDFGPFMTGNQAEQYGRGTGKVAGGSHLEGARSVDQLQYLGAGGGYEHDDSFSSPLGSRDRNYGIENSGQQQRITSASSCFVINQSSTSCQRSSSPLCSSTMDQSGPLPALPSRSSLNVPIASTSLALPVASAASTSSTSSPVSPSARSPGKLKGLAKELFDLIHYGWYWGGLSKEEAEEKLKNEPDGAFIVRDSSSSVHILSLSFNSKGKTKHTRIDYVNGKFCFLSSETEAFSSVAELIEHWIRNSEQGIYCYSKSNRANGPTSYPVRLTKPISRFTEVKSLQFLSSFVLYQYTRLDLIPKLPLPPQLIEFIGQQHYF